MQAFDDILSLPSGPTRVRVRGDGPALIWSHGVFFPLDVDDQSTLGRVLGDAQGFTVVRYDACGHGRTPPRASAQDHRWDRMADDVFAIADALGIERFTAGGISMGAAVSLYAALATPSRITSMLLLALPTAWETRAAERARYQELLAFGSPGALADHVQEDFDGLFQGAAIPASLVAMIAAIRSQSWPTLTRVIGGAAESDMPDRARLAGLRIPVLVRPWPNDSGHPLSTAESLAAALPAADMALLESFDDEAGMRAALARLRQTIDAGT